jgi:hypothetical protein
MIPIIPSRYAVITRYAVAAVLLFAWGSSALPAPALHAPGGGAVRALVIGIDKYPSLGGAADLHGAVVDARDISATLKAAGVPADNVRELIDGAATRARVIEEMDRLIGESKAGDLVIIAYSGHSMKVRGYKRWDGAIRDAVQSQLVLSNYSPKSGHEFIVDGEMRAWYSRFDARDVDVLAVMDTASGGHMHMREVMPFSGGVMTRAVPTEMDEKIHDSFQPIDMTEKEVRLSGGDELRHLTFFGGATEESTVPEMSGIDWRNRAQVRGALSYFMARAFGGKFVRDGAGAAVTRLQLFKYVSPNVRAATESRQFIDFGPRTDDDAALQRVVFVLGEGDRKDDGRRQGPAPVTALPPQAEPVRVAIVNGDEKLFQTIEKGRAPFELSELSAADIVWDAGQRMAQSRGDLVSAGVDGSLMGLIIDRTWAVREIQKLAVPRIIDVRMGENGRAYTVGEQVSLVADGVRDSYLTVVNVASDGTLQFLFPYYPSHNPHVMSDQWMYSPKVDLPLGTDYTVVVSTDPEAAAELVKWLREHNHLHDAVDLPAVLAKVIEADGKTRIGTAGLFTH